MRVVDASTDDGKPSPWRDFGAPAGEANHLPPRAAARIDVARARANLDRYLDGASVDLEELESPELLLLAVDPEEWFAGDVEGDMSGDDIEALMKSKRKWTSSWPRLLCGF